MNVKTGKMHSGSSRTVKEEEILAVTQFEDRGALSALLSGRVTEPVVARKISEPGVEYVFHLLGRDDHYLYGNARLNHKESQKTA